MRVIPLSEVVKMGEGESVPATKGVVTFVGQYYQGISKAGTPNAGKAWQLQNVTLADPANKAVTMSLKLDGREAVTNAWKGKTIHLISHQSTKGMTGLVIKMDGKPGKEKLVIKITPSAEITLGAPTEATHQPEDTMPDERGDDGDLGPQAGFKPTPEHEKTFAGKPPAQQSQPTAQPPLVTKPMNGKQAKDPVIVAMECAGQVGNLIKIAYWKALSIANEIEEETRKEEGQAGFRMSTEQIGSAAMNITIQLEKTAVHTHMPIKPITRPQPKSKE